ncbi:MAG: pyruvate kinase [Alphaproteobacteria bacterium]|nr:pyruvate kinase [Alphaproteobacteria bacterium]
MHKLTRITASIGPTSESKETIREMIAKGMNIARLNFSHDTHEAHGKKIVAIRELSEELKTPIAIMADLQGPKHRIGDFETDDKYPLIVGQEFILDNDPTPGNSARVQLPDPDVLKSLKVGDRVLLNDGKIELEVMQSTGASVITKIVRGTEIWSRRGFNIPDTMVETGILTEKDKKDLEYIITQNPDYVAVSFVQKPEDIKEVIEFINARGNNTIKIVAKIERPQALECLEEIADIADAIMVARGDLAVEVDFWKVPAITRNMIRICRRKNKPIIIATQMMSSMVNSEFPMRSEISDVAQAAYLRADSVMTSEETTLGEYPVLVMDAMRKILKASEFDARENVHDWQNHENLPENDWSRSVVSMAYLNKCTAIVVFVHGGRNARAISARRPDVPIVAICNDQVAANQLVMNRGVFPIYNPEMFDKRDITGALAHIGGIKEGKVVVVDDETVTLQ